MGMRRLFPDPGPTSADEQVGHLDLNGLAGGERPYVVSNFALTVDGQATIAGRSGAIGSGADTALFHLLRTRADAIIVGAGTIRTERYGPMIEDSAARSRRDRDSLAHYPLAVIVSERFDLPWDIPLFTSGLGSVLIATATDAERPETATTVRVVRHSPKVDVARLLRELRQERGVRSLLCEGGPHLHAELFALDLLDELFLTRASKLGGGSGPGLFAGAPERPTELEAVWMLEQDGELFGRYRVRRDESG
jgi:riboflavin-specific deaminase-like protein